MHTKLRMMALGVILLGGGATVAQAEAGPECSPVNYWVEYCPGGSGGGSMLAWCDALQPGCFAQSAYCDGAGGMHGYTVVCNYWDN
jgi:hypothetical protein